MKKEDRELLVRDLCARLPYNTIISVTNDDDNRNTIQYLVEEDIKDLRSTISYSGNIYKPYLFPLSSMTEEQALELEKIDPEFYSLISENGNIHISMDIRGYDWLLKNNFDFRGLIPMGLALDATGLNIY
jgi:hypothetical protein